jgi:hypothetical protein
LQKQQNAKSVVDERKRFPWTLEEKNERRRMLGDLNRQIHHVFKGKRKHRDNYSNPKTKRRDIGLINEEVNLLFGVSVSEEEWRALRQRRRTGRRGRSDGEERRGVHFA